MLKKVMLIAEITLAGVAFPAVSISKCSHTFERSQRPDAQQSLNLVGEIMDSRCAIDGSHEKMMRQNGLKNAKDCTLECAKSGGSFVLFDPETKTVYQLTISRNRSRSLGNAFAFPGHTTSPRRLCTSSRSNLPNKNWP